MKKRRKWMRQRCLALIFLLGLTGCQSGLGEKKTGKAGDCTISITCGAILENPDALDPAKKEFVPADGWILLPSEVEFFEGDTVFDVLKIFCRDANIQMESSYTPLYGSYYVEGIRQIYELDCGPNSGWTYRVNGRQPNYGCSAYVLKDGDEVEWVYACGLGTMGEEQNLET